ncbi:hypothetical protein CJ030_MR1G009133 [Morella rubra]|uniref:Uncharacterized protein n=1 Tax=Morella rubra TaxID=262757 RepID=A0A6A1WMC4_9ROSI|nr:hypothetical protein CJ030_MR1G009133 [Morella rubra]
MVVNSFLMCDLQVLAKEQLCAASSPLPASNSNPGSIGADSWAAAEPNAEEVVGRIHPSLAAEHKRTEVIEYLQGLVRFCVGCEVHHRHRQDISSFSCSVGVCGFSGWYEIGPSQHENGLRMKHSTSSLSTALGVCDLKITMHHQNITTAR